MNVFIYPEARKNFIRKKLERNQTHRHLGDIVRIVWLQVIRFSLQENIVWF